MVKVWNWNGQRVRWEFWVWFLMFRLKVPYHFKAVLMTNRPPAPGTYDPRDWKCPNCKTLNFKKRKNCLSCSTERPPQTREQVMPDWRTGKKDCGANVNADWTCRGCGKFNLACDRFCLSCAVDVLLDCPCFRDVDCAKAVRAFCFYLPAGKHPHIFVHVYII